METTSFFITNFPMEASTEDLNQLFVKFGRVGEVYVPKKLDIKGRRFGFVKFKDVTNVEVLSDKLKDVWFGTFKLWINRTRFGRSDSKEVSPQPVPFQRPPVSMEEVTPGKSFRKAVLGNSDKGTLLKVPVNEALCKELQGSFVGTLTCEKDVKRIQTTLYMEGFQSVSVTYMGGNMALLRSPVEGDMERLMKSKKDSLNYYFSKLKPWNPGLRAVNREVWIQVYGIPLHVWGEELFKMVGENFGGFLDFDDDTAAMVRCDVARLKISSTSWELIDVVIKVEVEGVCFNLWVVEERGRQNLEVFLGDDREDGGSLVMPVANSEAGRSGGSIDGVANSGEDDDSGNDLDVDVSGEPHNGGRLEVVGGGTMQSQEARRGDFSLACAKSTNISLPQKEILSVQPGNVGNEVTGEEQVACGMVLAVSDEGVERERCLLSGTQGGVDVEKVVLRDSGPIVSVDHLDLSPNPITPIQTGLGQSSVAPSEMGFQGEFLEPRYSSISEPEEVLSSHRKKKNRNIPKSGKQKSCAKFNPLGVPKCLQMAEASTGAGSKVRRRRVKHQGDQTRGVEVRAVERVVDVETMAVNFNCTEGKLQQSKTKQPGYRSHRQTPSSGIDLLSGSGDSMVAATVPSEPDGEKQKLRTGSY
ncbi:hypothetical protein TSUD_132910 [Trifolium subterraneum]|uniref:RRM domain-containing protein n=1 Tax=Trifolium subterraneum TaxID=3900 RepID=A0A2Z6LUZ6_TRISU|nr:hypothetical protein TSUD_132910 [Trifolium subterraneum]